MPMRPPAANARTQSARPMPRSIARHRYATPMIRAGACGLPASAARKPPTALPRRDRTTPPAACSAWRPAPTTSSRRAALPVLPWPAAGTNFSVVNGGTGRSDLFQAGVFVRHAVGSAYIAGALAYGWQNITTDRTVTIAGVDRLRAQFNANAFSGRVEGGYRFVTPWMGVTPYAAAQFTTFDLPAYAEQVLSGANSFALAYAAKSVYRVAQRTGYPLGQVIRDAGFDPDLARPRRLGPRLQQRSQYRRDVPDAAGRIVCRQRRGASKRLRARHRFGRDKMA